VSVAPGTVYLVGAGPGDPGLLTLRGAECLRRADAVVHDALVPDELLALAPEGALRIDVGKRGHEEPIHSQEEVNALLVRLAREGRTVVRLKSGDPFVFGRGGEEASACAAAGVPFEVVPGVSAALGGLAYAGIPVTDRRHASSFTVLTGHRDPTPSARSLRWRELARGADTLVVLMGMRHLRAILARLVEHGRDPATPAAAMMRGSTGRQRTVVATLGGLADAVEAAGLGRPAAVVVGDVVRLREELAWFERRPLFGRRVLVTRPVGQNLTLAALLRAAGAEPRLVPLVRVVPAPPAPLDARLEKLEDYDAILLTSRNAARLFAERLARRAAPAATPPALCVGEATAAEARVHGLPAWALVGEGGGAEGLLERLRERGAVGHRFLLPCAAAAGDRLPRGLRELGAQVDRVDVYRTEPAPVDGAALRAELEDGAFDVLCFASPSAVRAFDALLDPGARAAAHRSRVVAIGPSTARALTELRLAPDAVAARPGDAGLVEAIVAVAESGGRS
jgi:uroporphyrinogen III methyltransferase/synthase